LLRDFELGEPVLRYGQIIGLANHGQPLPILKRTTWEELYAGLRADFFEAEAGGDKVFVGGLSMSALFVLLLAEEFGDAKMFRPNRDVRFSADKSPYKTHAACWFFHADASSKVGREAHGGGAGFYFHLQPGASFVGGGCWMPPRPALKRIRAALAADPLAFERVLRNAPHLVEGLVELKESRSGHLSDLPRMANRRDLAREEIKRWFGL